MGLKANKFWLKKGTTLSTQDIVDLAKDLKQEIEFAQRLEKAWTSYEKGKFKTKSAEKFLEELDKC